MVILVVYVINRLWDRPVFDDSLNRSDLPLIAW